MNSTKMIKNKTAKDQSIDLDSLLQGKPTSMSNLDQRLTKKSESLQRGNSTNLLQMRKGSRPSLQELNERESSRRYSLLAQDTLAQDLPEEVEQLEERDESSLESKQVLESVAGSARGTTAQDWQEWKDKQALMEQPEDDRIELEFDDY